MAFSSSVSNPLYSFTKIVGVIQDPPCLGINFTKHLPISFDFPLTHSFQLKLTETTDENTKTYYYASPVKECCTALPSQVPLNKDMPYIYKATKRLLDGETDKYVLNFWEEIGNVKTYDTFNHDIETDILDLCQVACNDVISFEIVQEVETFNGVSWDLVARNSIGITNSFQLYCGTDCFKSLVEYRCNENSFDFIYEGGVFTNRQVLPINLSRPQITSETSSYRKSNGENIKLNETIDEKWQLETDWIVYTAHKWLKIALAHDSVKVFSDLHKSFNGLATLDNDNPSFICESEYTIEWNEFLTLEAKGKTELKTRFPYYLSNNNCG